MDDTFSYRLTVTMHVFDEVYGRGERVLVCSDLSDRFEGETRQSVSAVHPSKPRGERWLSTWHDSSLHALIPFCTRQG